MVADEHLVQRDDPHRFLARVLDGKLLPERPADGGQLGLFGGHQERLVPLADVEPLLFGQVLVFEFGVLLGFQVLRALLEVRDGVAAQAVAGGAVGGSGA